MEALIPYLRIIHFLGFALLFGGVFSSFLIVRKNEDSLISIKNSYLLLHLAAAPGLTILLITGLLHSFAMSFENFKGAGFMHAKLTLVLFSFVVLFIDMKERKSIIKQNLNKHEMARKLKHSLYCDLSILFLSLIIIYLVSFRPF